MDRRDDIESSLPKLLSQDYPDFTVVVVDLGSQDGLREVLARSAGPRLQELVCPRPQYFNFSQARNIGLRYSFSDLVLFLNGDTVPLDDGQLRRIVYKHLTSMDIDRSWWHRWRVHMGYKAVRSVEPVLPGVPARRVYSHCMGSLLLVERRFVQALGGFNEAITDWGYEDTDMLARLELSNFGRIEMESLATWEQDESLRTANFRVKDKSWTWRRNRWLSDRSIRAFGVSPPLYELPGACPAIEIDGVAYEGSEAPQQEWVNSVNRVALLRWRMWLLAYGVLGRRGSRA